MTSELESENETLTKKIDEFEETVSRLRETVKVKTAELCKARLSEGRLQIEANKLKSDMSTFRLKFEACLVKFKKEIDALSEERDSLKMGGGFYDRIKSSFEKVWKRDEEFCQTSQDLDSECGFY
jgi:chromosome segregation ATPase